MPALTRWSPLSRYPLTESLSKFMPTAGNAGKKPVFVSESLCGQYKISPHLYEANIISTCQMIFYSDCLPTSYETVLSTS
jgi:hypothetical protein